LAGKGAVVAKDAPLAIIHARDEAGFENAAAIIRAAYVIGKPQRKSPAIIERIAPSRK
jgi:thymidine phosphorylase